MLWLLEISCTTQWPYEAKDSVLAIISFNNFKFGFKGTLGRVSYPVPSPPYLLIL
jgi:hypothetical protein